MRNLLRPLARALYRWTHHDSWLGWRRGYQSTVLCERCLTPTVTWHWDTAYPVGLILRARCPRCGEMVRYEATEGREERVA